MGKTKTKTFEPLEGLSVRLAEIAEELKAIRKKLDVHPLIPSSTVAFRYLDDARLMIKRVHDGLERLY